MTIEDKRMSEREVELLVLDARRQGFLLLDREILCDREAIDLAQLAWQIYCEDRGIPRIVLTVPRDNEMRKPSLEFDSSTAKGNVWPLDKPVEIEGIDDPCAQAFAMRVTFLVSNVLDTIITVETRLENIEQLYQLASKWAARYITSKRHRKLQRVEDPTAKH
jgi:hypothetical protein